MGVTSGDCDDVAAEGPQLPQWRHLMVRLKIEDPQYIAIR